MAPADYVSVVILMVFIVRVNSTSFCGVRYVDSEDNIDVRDRGFDSGHVYPEHFGELEIPVAIYYDKPMFRKLGSQEALNKFVLAHMKTAQSVFDDPRIQKRAKITFRVVRIREYTSSILKTSDGDAYQVLKQMEDDLPQGKGSTRSRGLSILLTGRNAMSNVGTAREASSLTGLANVAVLCFQPYNSVGLVEGRNFNSAYVFAHEIAHMFGVNHDGDSKYNTANCSADYWIMSPSAGDGKVAFSDCSVASVIQHLKNVHYGQSNGKNSARDPEYFNRCFKTPVNDTLSGYEDLRSGPKAGDLYDADRQCQHSLGKGYKADFTAASNVCPMVYCTHNFWQVKSHPALPGTPCAADKKCDANSKCV